MKTLFILFSVLGILIGFESALFADCYAVSVAGCGKTEKVCVDSSTPETVSAQAVAAFKDKNNCQKVEVVSDPLSCDIASCDVRVGG